MRPIIPDVIHEGRDAVESVETSFVTRQSTALVNGHCHQSPAAILAHLMNLIC
jgi:hypothetical protein